MTVQINPPHPVEGKIVNTRGRAGAAPGRIGPQRDSKTSQAWFTERSSVCWILFSSLNSKVTTSLLSTCSLLADPDLHPYRSSKSLLPLNTLKVYILYFPYIFVLITYAITLVVIISSRTTTECCITLELRNSSGRPFYTYRKFTEHIKTFPISSVAKG